MPTDTVSDILDLLDRERDALRTGLFQDLDALGDTKQRLFAKLTQGAPEVSDLKQIKVRLSENKKLFSAAIRGVSAARDRIDALQNVREGLNVYDQSGQMAKVSTGQPVLRKKA